MKKYASKKQVRMFRSMASLLRAGLPVTKAMSVAGFPLSITETVAGGRLVSDALLGYCDDGAVRLIRMGESSADLESSLETAAFETERRAKQKEKLVRSLLYPATVLAGCVVTMIVFLYYILPQLESSFGSMGIPLPSAVKALKMLPPISMICAAAFFLAAVAVKAAYKDPLKAEKIEKLFFMLPLIGPVIREQESAGIFRYISVLLASGCTLSSAVRAASAEQKYVLFKNALTEISADVDEGKNLSDAIAGQQLFSSGQTELIRVAESSGNVQQSLRSVSEFLEENSQDRLSVILGLAEPLSTVAVGAFVCFIVLTMFSPIIRALNIL